MTLRLHMGFLLKLPQTSQASDWAAAAIISGLWPLPQLLPLWVTPDMQGPSKSASSIVMLATRIFKLSFGPLQN
ncbi:hypothetical protein CERZMDRAFT_103747 [Cercospora zeae-maydis SCOH1-5]|uniref:Uncharacterized protein n=1 Tax=Cercospora zeae-maydis SCOH1-5 TaxID=717836 RepID=A0A6A6EZ02_9PEZI|nr:hypothetical protein CERZMDRAFT_103747 [Cercospora zeae-maydis SCOH1-5]